MQAAKRPAISIPTRRHPSGARKEGAPVAWAILAWVVGLIVFFPAFYIVATGFKSEATAVQLPPKFIPIPGHPDLGWFNQFIFDPTLEQYREVKSRGFVPFFENSIIASLISTAIVLVLAVPAAYALALRPMKHWKDILFFFISTKFMPPAGIIIPLYIIFKNAHPAEHDPGPGHHVHGHEPADRDLDAALILRGGAAGQSSMPPASTAPGSSAR